MGSVEFMESQIDRLEGDLADTEGERDRFKDRVNELENERDELKSRLASAVRSLEDTIRGLER
jgi:chromosome segregation ATPase